MTASMTFRQAGLTPAEAAAMLTRRRPVSRSNPAAIRSYAEAMRQGRWVLNGMPIILSRSGVLLDGLQRLEACMAAGVPFPTFIAENVADDVLHTIDQQRRRSFAGVLEARGIRHARAVQAMLAKLIHYDDGRLGRDGVAAPSWARMERALAANPDIAAAAAASLSEVDTTLPEPVRTPLLFMGRRAAPGAMAQLLAVVADPDRHPLTEPGVLLRHEIDRGREDGAARLAPGRLLALSILALNATGRGTALRRLAWTGGAPGRPADPYPRLEGYAGLGETRLPAAVPVPEAIPTQESGSALRWAIESIDPARAEAYLRHNTRNRRIVQAHVNAIARDIVAGRWMVNAQPICFAADGTLLNGQHRLMAVILADGAIEVPVIRGLEPAAQATYDLHAKRSPEFGPALESFGDRALVSAMANLLWRRELRPPGARHAKATAAEIRDIVCNHPRLLELRSFGRKMIDHGRASVMGYGAYVIERSDPVRGPDFLRALETGAELATGHPILALRRQLQRLRRDKVPQEDQLAALLGGWERYRGRAGR
ncbi:hypothetical protein E2C06_19000 [Dankookia rubra]|uniref:ParB/Sulfiredoxin domain-containing protein n=1 Tax=Dankookia rubra TaxID=1442381 RepID=A0A4R5QDN7_9PROT|nr:hypothetical protein [Dankookia rubra]TDH61066.1 hypothetical protein E2C06_19000 [Dankookia rubra]